MIIVDDPFKSQSSVAGQNNGDKENEKKNQQKSGGDEEKKKSGAKECNIKKDKEKDKDSVYAYQSNDEKGNDDTD